MIVSFGVTNYRSIKKQAVLNMVSNAHIPSGPMHKAKFGRLGVLKSVGIFGANGSGKTTIIKALSDMKSMILKGISVDDLSFKGEENIPTSFDLCFETQGCFFEYGFSVVRNTLEPFLEIVEEYLYELKMNGKTEAIYTRESGVVGSNNPDIITYQKGYSKTKGLLFLPYILAPERYDETIKPMPKFKMVFDFFLKELTVSLTSDELMFSIFGHDTHSIVKKLNEYDTGIEDVDFESLNESERFHVLSDPVVSGVIIPGVEKSPKGSCHYFSNGKDLYSFTKEESAVSVRRLLFKHLNIDKKLCFCEESEGTRAVFMLIATLLCSDDSDKTIVIDEIEKSTHPLIVARLIEDYLKFNENKKGQLIFTSHMNSLMDNVLKRDEIYFAEKDLNGVTTLVSLQEYRTRNRREHVGEKYIEGTYGAIPNIGVYVE